jgi:hypothetical protein
MEQDAMTSGVTGPVCHCCGKPLPPGNLSWDYPAPDPVASMSQAQLAQRIAFRSQRVISVTGLGNFISVILPVAVEHEREATLGIWLHIPEQQDCNQVMEAGRKGGKSWDGLRFAGGSPAVSPPPPNRGLRCSAPGRRPWYPARPEPHESSTVTIHYSPRCSPPPGPKS